MKYLIFSLFITLSCAHTCITPEERASDKGTVMECHDTYKNNHKYRKCVVLTSNATESFTFRQCKGM